MSHLSTERRSCAAVTARLERDGFPELVRHWKRFLRLGLETEALSAEEIGRKRRAHTAPLFGNPSAVAAALGILSLLGGFGWAAFIDSGGIGAGFVPASITAALFCASIFALSIYAITTIQRYWVNPLENLLAVEVALALSVVQFGAWVNASPPAKEVMAELARLGVNDRWDDASYRASYIAGGKDYERVDDQTLSDLTLSTVRDFAGRKEGRKHIPGQFSSALKQGKKSVTEICRTFECEISACKAGTLTSDAALTVLTGLLSHVDPQHSVFEMLQRKIELVRSGSLLRPGEIRAELWQRDPWVDLTHQSEFFSSASLRGVHPMGRGSKGRLGPFGYLYSKAVSALDFRNRQGRVVRARLGAAKDLGSAQAILFVDGVEGSNVIAPAIIQRAVEDYARTCGFRFVLYNAFSHNQVPKRFIRFVAGRALLKRHVDLAYVDLSARLYLDSFGYPLEPFEYQVPKGGVIGYLSVLDSTVSDLPGTSPTLVQSISHWFRQNCLWVLVTGSVAFALTQLLAYAPMTVVPFLLVVGTLGAVHLRYQRKSLRVN